MRSTSLLVAAAALLAACNTATVYPTAVARAATDAPAAFTRENGSAVSGTAGAATCFSPLVDPRNQARITMVRASQGSGDYSAPSGAYGVGAGELLRIDCSNGRALGVVRG